MADVLAVAHRAGNSLAGVHEANLWGADVIEADVHAHRGRLEVRHLKTAGPLPFLWDRWELVPAGAPRLLLDQLMDADRRGARLMLDLKGLTGRSAVVGRAVAGALRQRGLQEEIWVCGRHWPAVDLAAELDHVRPVLSARRPVEREFLEHRLAARSRPGPYGISVHVSLLDARFVAAARDRVSVVMTWPVEDLTTLRRVTALGVNAVTTTEADVVRQVRRQRRPPDDARDRSRS